MKICFTTVWPLSKGGQFLRCRENLRFESPVVSDSSKAPLVAQFDPDCLRVL